MDVVTLWYANDSITSEDECFPLKFLHVRKTDWGFCHLLSSLLVRT